MVEELATVPQYLTMPSSLFLQVVFMFSLFYLNTHVEFIIRFWFYYNSYTGHTTMNIGVLKLCRIYYSDLTITNYTSMNEQLKQFVLQVFVHVCTLWFLRLPLEALVAKMATREQKAFCVLQFTKTESVIRV